MYSTSRATCTVQAVLHVQYKPCYMYSTSHATCTCTCRAYNFVFPLPVRIHCLCNACGNPEALHMLQGLEQLINCTTPYTQGTVLPSMPYWKYIKHTSNMTNFVTQIHITGPLWSLHFSSCVRHVLSTFNNISMTKVSMVWGQFINNSVTHNAYYCTNAQPLRFASVVCGTLYKFAAV